MALSNIKKMRSELLDFLSSLLSGEFQALKASVSKNTNVNNTIYSSANLSKMHRGRKDALLKNASK